MLELPRISNLSEQKFVDTFIAQNKPVVVTDIPFDTEYFNPQSLVASIGELNAQVYDTLFDLENIQSLAEYIEDHFAKGGPIREDVPYIRWYNTLKDVDFPWGDKAFEAISAHWKTPDCVPRSDLIVPVCEPNQIVDPVTDLFPYRGVLVAARGARTRLHRDPFCSDAVVSMFYGEKEVALFHPERTEELMESSDGSSFGGFKDLRKTEPNVLSLSADFHGVIGAGEMIYIPHGWLHDVLVLEDSISVTWNFVHQQGSREYQQYLMGNPHDDPEFEVLQYFYARAGYEGALAERMMAVSGCM